MNKMELLLTKKKVLKSNITKATSEIDKNVFSKIELELYEKKCSKFEIDNSVLFDKIFENCDKKELDKFIEEQALVNETIDNLWILVKNKLSSLDTNISNAKTEYNCVDNIRLPKLNLPSFNGNIQEWLSFRDLFRASIHNNSTLSDSQKLSYLKLSLQGDAAKVIQSISINDINYNIAWSLLEERYSNTKEQVFVHLKRFMSIPPVTNDNPYSVLKLVDTVNECTRSLELLEQKIEGFSETILAYILLQKLDSTTKLWWEREHKGDDLPKISDLVSFLKQYARTLQASKTPVSNVAWYKKNPQNQKVTSLISSVKPSNTKCICCLSDNCFYLYKCSQFLRMNPYERIELIKKHKVCFRCLSYKNMHSVKNCYSKLSCEKCRLRNHNTLLHLEQKRNDAPPVERIFCQQTDVGRVEIKQNELLSPSSGNILNPDAKCFRSNDAYNSEFVGTSVNGYFSRKQDQIKNFTSRNVNKSVSILPTAKIRAIVSDNSIILLRVLMDCGSESSYCSEHAINKLGIKRRKNARLAINGIGSLPAGFTRGAVSVNLVTKVNNEIFEVDAYILDKLTSFLPSKSFDTSDLEHIKGISLADPDFAKPSEIDMILGADYFFSILRSGQIIGAKGQPIAQNTIFGWVISGKIASSEGTNATNSHFCNIEEKNVDVILHKFWSLEELPVKGQLLSEEEQFCENHFKQNYRLNDEGRFVVKLPIYKDTSQLVNAKAAAISRMLAMERKFQNNELFQRDYKLFMQDYEKIGHMKLIDTEKEEVSKTKVHYLPHHVSTRLRVVFDGSYKTVSSDSLNSILAVGKTLQPDIFSLLVKFRSHKVVFSADIKQMFRQVLISPEDQDLQRIMWRESENAEMKEYKLCTVTYGTASAPFLATRALLQIGLDCTANFPSVSPTIQNSFYMDDLMAGSETVQSAISTATKLTELLEERGFHLRKWRSNSPEFLSRLSTKSAEESTLEILPVECCKALGLLWDSVKDTFIFKVDLKFNDVITKRNFLSQSAKLFDPLGLLSPCTISIKIFYQQLWALKLGWDTPFPDKLQERWKVFQQEFELVNVIQIPRWIYTCEKSISLHGFSDASEKAYAGVIYAVQPDEDGNINVTLLAAKAKVAPLKVISIP